MKHGCKKVKCICKKHWPGHPLQTTQADKSRKFLLLVYFLHASKGHSTCKFCKLLDKRDFFQSICFGDERSPNFPHLCSYSLIEWCFTPVSIVFQSYHSDWSHYSWLSWISSVLGWGSKLSCQRTTKNPDDPLWLKPRTPGLQVKHFTTKQCKTPCL